MYKLIIVLALLQIIIINSKSLNNNAIVDNVYIRNNTSEISRNFNPPKTDGNHNKSDNILTFQKFKFIKKNNFNQHHSNIVDNNDNNNKTIIIKENHLLNVNEGRGDRKKIKKKFKMLTPVLLMMLAATSIFLPFLLKGLAIVSTSSFIMSKISLILSLLVLLRFLYTKSTESKIEIHSVPIKSNKHGWHDRQSIGYNDDINYLNDITYGNANYSAPLSFNQFHI